MDEVAHTTKGLILTYYGFWGVMCENVLHDMHHSDDDYEAKTAGMICKSLGYSGKKAKVLALDPKDYKYEVDGRQQKYDMICDTDGDVDANACLGDEKHFRECPNLRWGQQFTHCDSGLAVGLECHHKEEQ